MSNSYIRIRIFWQVCLLFAVIPLYAQNGFDSMYLDKVKDSVSGYYRLHPRKLMSSEERRFKVMPLYGVSYSPESAFNAMGGFFGSYRTSWDTLVPHSKIGVLASISTNLHIAGAVVGTYYHPYGDFMLAYSAKFNHSSAYFWGFGYDNATNNNFPGNYTEQLFRLRTDYLYRRHDRWLLGGFIGYTYYNVSKMSDSALFNSAPTKAHYLYSGLRFDLDTRDDAFTPEYGVFLNLEQSIWFPVVRSGKIFSKTSLTADFYFPGWDGAVFAIDVAGEVKSDNAPWMFWPNVGGNERMRGYYTGRYRDRNFISAQLELRQKIYKWHGIAIWGGAGNVFPSFKMFDMKNTLPTYGAGYRFAFYSIVFRLDFAFGLPGQWAILAGFNHSF